MDAASSPSASPALPPATHVLYLHGFRSSPRSYKAQRLAAHLAAHCPQVHWACPQLPASPAAAWAQIEAAVAGWPAHTAAVVGSSLGGFYATRLAAHRGWRAVLINPAVDPARDLARHIGEHPAWHDPAERIFFRPEYVDELRQLATGALPHPQRVLLIAATGDEVLDWREMVARYPGSRHHIVPGSDHALSDFDAHLPVLLAHLGLD
ncbi:YqiA/YcfP family alpha/beta fold hydrolase [Tepidimonas sp.]|uniref:YqiA/YcfP family alpha/beta fold hydrolase n=1 Tax=Tepidimonas sp. TaxID=2002775 RepID=UPI002FE088EE